jgi:hypothetical protein
MKNRLVALALILPILAGCSFPLKTQKSLSQIPAPVAEKAPDFDNPRVRNDLANYLEETIPGELKDARIFHFGYIGNVTAENALTLAAGIFYGKTSVQEVRRRDGVSYLIRNPYFDEIPEDFEKWFLHKLDMDSDKNILSNESRPYMEGLLLAASQSKESALFYLGLNE